MIARLQTVKASTLLMWSMLVSVWNGEIEADAAAAKLAAQFGFLDDTRGQADQGLINTMLLVIVASVIGLVGLVVLSKTDDVVSFEANSAFNNSSESLKAGVSTFFSLIEVVYISLMLALVIGALLVLQRTR